jgi:hypothetical protein
MSVASRSTSGWRWTRMDSEQPSQTGAPRPGVGWLGVFPAGAPQWMQLRGAWVSMSVRVPRVGGVVKSNNAGAPQGVSRGVPGAYGACALISDVLAGRQRCGISD